MNNILIVIVLQRGCLPKHWAASCIFSEPVCSRMWPHFVAQSCRHKTANCKRVATVSIDDLRGWLRNSLRVFTKLTHALTKTIRRSVAHALLFIFVAPPVLGRAEKNGSFGPLRLRSQTCMVVSRCYLLAHALNRCSSGIHLNIPIKRNPDSRKNKTKYSPASL